MFIKEINRRGQNSYFIYNLAMVVPLLDNFFIKEKIKNLISYLYTKLLYLCLYVGKKHL